jgi:protoheme IX farnesyltransferase
VTKPGTFSDYLELTKPRLSLLSVLTAMAAYAAARSPHEPLRYLWVLIGTALAAGGVAVLNQWLEVDTDAQMHRTADRPIPSGKIPTGSAFILGALMCTASLMLLFGLVNALSAGFTLLTIFAYLGCYTPAKRRSRWSTEIGAVAGALPPLIGWAAGADRLAPLGWALFAMLFFWQIPHFMAIAWIHRKDYSAVHFPMLPVRDSSGRWVSGWSLINAVLLVAASLIPVYLGLDTRYYGGVAAAAGVLILICALRFLPSAGRDRAARQLFLATIAYLPVVLGALVLDRVVFFPV